ncbi:MAG: WD40 repeat domain-containing protein [Nostoc sp.]
MCDRFDINHVYNILGLKPGASVLDNHSDWVNSVAFSPDGKTLVSGSRDMTIKLWQCDD